LTVEWQFTYQRSWFSEDSFTVFINLILFQDGVLTLHPLDITQLMHNTTVGVAGKENSVVWEVISPLGEFTWMHLLWVEQVHHKHLPTAVDPQEIAQVHYPLSTNPYTK
jgi:hypothetical protein